MSTARANIYVEALPVYKRLGEVTERAPLLSFMETARPCKPERRATAQTFYGVRALSHPFITPGQRFRKTDVILSHLTPGITRAPIQLSREAA